jgi:hypothetical protein
MFEILLAGPRFSILSRETAKDVNLTEIGLGEPDLVTSIAPRNLERPDPFSIRAIKYFDRLHEVFW